MRKREFRIGKTGFMLGALLLASMLGGCQAGDASKEESAMQQQEEASSEAASDGQQDNAVDDAQERDGQKDDAADREAGQENTDSAQTGQENADEPGSDARSEESDKEQTQSGSLNTPFTVTMAEKSGELKSDDGQICYLEWKSMLPTVSSETNPQAAQQINYYFLDQEEEILGDKTEVLEWAKEDYQYRQESADELGQEVSWCPYTNESGYKQERSDGKILSFSQSIYSYAGGAHGSHFLGGVTFDAATGQKLDLADLSEEPAKFRAFLEEKITEQANEIQAAYERGESDFGLFDEYEAYIPDVLTDTSWYLTDQGIEVIANEYLLAPYAAGPIYFEVPYEELTLLKEVYQP